MTRSPLRLTVLGQSLIQHDLRSGVWPDFATFAEMFERADACFTDLETAIHSPLAEAATREGVFLHAADPAVLDCLRALAISLLATANNHVWDLGTGGIAGMLGELDARVFAHTGAGLDLLAASRPAYRHTPNGVVALIAAASGSIREGAAATATRAGVNELRCGIDGELGAGDAGRMFEAIREGAAHADIVLACHHNHILEDGGRRTPAWQRRFAHHCVEAGASLYVGHGAPRLHGIEIYRGRPIFHNLGNFIFHTATEDGFYDAEVWRSMVAECRFDDGRFLDVHLTPVQLDADGRGGSAAGGTRGRPSIAQGAAANLILDRVRALSRPFGTVIEPNGGVAVIRAE